jgi:hypothetical protein
LRALDQSGCLGEQVLAVMFVADHGRHTRRAKAAG